MTKIGLERKTSMTLKTRILNVLLITFVFFAIFQTSAFAKDDWIMVNSRNFKLIGNAGDKDIRRVGTKLEQFREVFRLLLSQANLTSPVPTTVFVFKSESAYRPFKPRRADGKADDFIAGYFQSGEDVNYITLSTEGESAQTFGVIFHEYVHNIVNMNFGKSEIPPWFNEGLAEYYATFAIENDQNVKLGMAEARHIRLLQDNKLIPLETLFGISNAALHQNGDHSRSIFYAESWALMHYLLQGSAGGNRSAQLSKFLGLLLKNVPAEKAFQEAFQMTYAQMENELKKYVSQSSYKYTYYNFKNKLTFDADMKTSPVSEATANAYLGDLLLHTNRADEAEPFLQKALALEPNLSMAHTSFGMVKLRQRKYDEAKASLEKAITDDQKNHLAYYKYAYLLSREGRDEFGFVSKFPPETSQKMREMLKKAIAINPEFTESYELLAFVCLVNNEQLDEAVQFLGKAMTLQPGNQQYAMRIAEIWSRQEKFKDSRELAEKLAKTTDEPEIKSRAESLLNRIRQMEEFSARNEQARKNYELATSSNAAKNKDGQPGMRRRDNADLTRDSTPEEIARADEEAAMRSINQSLRKPKAGQKQIIGSITKIACVNKSITYTVKTDKETVTLSSKDFQGLDMMSYNTAAEGASVGCNESFPTIKAVLTFNPVAATGAKSIIAGELVAIDFVPNDFRFIDAETAGKPVYIRRPSPENANQSSAPETSSEAPPPAPEKDLESVRRAAMMEGLKNALRKPEAGEKREQGLVEKIECDNKNRFFYLKTETRVFKLFNNTPNLAVRVFTPEFEGVQFGCGLKQLDIPVIFTYRPNADAKAKNDGEVVNLEFVPKSFKLE